MDIIADTLANTTPLSPPPNSWAAEDHNHVAIWHIHMDAEAEWQMPPCPQGVNRRIYYYQGQSLTAGQSHVTQGHCFDVEPQQNLSIVNHAEPSHMLVLQGRSINEAIAQQGPFVMNKQSELMEAFNDYQKTQFGGWPWPQADTTHPRHQARFISVGGKQDFPPSDDGDTPCSPSKPNAT